MKTLIATVPLFLLGNVAFAATAHQAHGGDNLSVVTLLAVGVVGLVIARRKTV